jgi:hypothetical protein
MDNISKEGSMIIRFSINEVSKLLYALRYVITNKTQKSNESREWIDSYGELISDIEGMLKKYEKAESAERKKESSEGSRVTETSS